LPHRYRQIAVSTINMVACRYENYGGHPRSSLPPTQIARGE
jgi:hypothetical protein